MTFAEIIIFILIGAVLFFSLSPLQKWSEARFNKFFRTKKTRSGTIIDITDYSKKDKHDG